MKKLFCIGVLSIAMIGCKNASAEQIEETSTARSGDTISVVDNNVPASDSEAETEVLAVDAAPKTMEPVAAKESAAKPDVAYASFGEKFMNDAVLTPSQMLSKYKNLKKGDTIAVKFKSSIKEVCKKKGCWMSMALPSAKESFVRFKDYGFFVPLNADGSEAIVSGRAFVDIITVAEQQHYAKDGGKSQEEIDKITEPKVTYAFQADGVMIRE